MFVLAITTFNRLSSLKRLIHTFQQTRNTRYRWTLVVADDGSDDGTREYLERLDPDAMPLKVIHNDRHGVHHQTNTILQYLHSLDFEVCFKCDDDIEFVKAGWDELYLQAIRDSGFDHLCHFDPNWRPAKNLKKPITQGRVWSQCRLKDVQGAFFTITPAMLDRLGYFDTQNFGFRGVGHIDYTARAARLGFTSSDHPYDARGGNEFIRHQRGSENSSLNRHLKDSLENDVESKRKYALILDPERSFVPLEKQPASMDVNTERELLISRLDTLLKEKEWYEKVYGHQPRWFVRIGKLFKYLKS